MIYNQKQRQLIIWDQKRSGRKLVSLILLLDLGLRIVLRDFSKKYSNAVKVGNYSLDSQTAINN